MGYILPIKTKTWKQVEETIRRRREEEERQRRAQDQIDLMAESQRRRQMQERSRQATIEVDREGPIPGYESIRRREESWVGGGTTVGQLEDPYLVQQEERRVRDEQERATRVGSPTGLPLAGAQQIRQPISPKAFDPRAEALGRQEGNTQAIREADRLQLEQEAEGPVPGARTDVFGETLATADRPRSTAPVVPVPLPQAAAPADAAKTGFMITPEFSKAIREDDALAQEFIDKHGPDVVLYEGRPSNWVPGSIGMERLVQTGVGLADIGFIAPTDFMMENIIQAGKYTVSDEGGDFKGYSEAVGAFRERDMITQILLGVVFDPAIVVGVLGLSMRVTRSLATGVTPLNRSQLRASIKNAAPEITDSEIDRATDRILEEFAKAGGKGPTGFSAQPAGGWQPQKPGRADLLKMGGYKAKEVVEDEGRRSGSNLASNARAQQFVDAERDTPGRFANATDERGQVSPEIMELIEEGVLVIRKNPDGTAQGDLMAGPNARTADGSTIAPEVGPRNLRPGAAEPTSMASIDVAESRRAAASATVDADLVLQEEALVRGEAKWVDQQASRAIRYADTAKVQRYMENLARNLGAGDLPEQTRKDIISQLTKSDNIAIQNQVFTRYLRTVQKILSDAAKTERDAVGEGAVPFGAGQRLPGEAGGRRVPGAPRPEYQLVEPEGELTAPPIPGVPQRTVSAGPGDPNVGTGRRGPASVSSEGDTSLERVNSAYDQVFKEPEGVKKSVGEKIREASEDLQGLSLDKYAKWNAASTRAEREFITVINDFLDADILRINAERLQDATSGGLSRDSAQVKALMVKVGDPGYEYVDRIPAEFNLQVQVSLSAGMPNAGRHVAERVLNEAFEKLGGKKLRVDPKHLDLFLMMRHSIDIVKLVNKYDPLQKPAGWKGRVKEAEALARRAPPTERGGRTGPAGMTLGDMQSKLWDIRQIYKDSGAYQNLLDAARVIRTHYSDLLDKQVTEGLVSKETADMLHVQFPYYNPIEYTEGVVQHVVDAGKRNSAYLLGVPANDLKELAKQGFNASVQPPLSTLAPHTMAVYASISRNRVARALIHTLINDPVWRHRIVKMSDEKGALKTAAAPSVVRGAGVGKPDQVTMARMIEGKAEVWSVPKEMGEMLTQLGQFDQNFLETALRTINIPQRMLYTAANPIFFVLNFIHDTFASMMKEGVMPHQTGWEMMAGLRKIIMGDHWEDELGNLMKEEGGYVGGVLTSITKGQDDILDSMASPIRNFIRTHGHSAGVSGSGIDLSHPLQGTQAEAILKRAADDPRLLGGIQNRRVANLNRSTFAKAASNMGALVKSPMWITSQLAEAVEQAPRRATFKKVTGQGYSVQEAAYRARQVTIDFRRRGRAMAMYDAAILYGNAAIQGAMLPIRTIDPGSMLFNPLTKGRHGSAGWSKFMAGQKRYGPGRLRLTGLMGFGIGVYAWNALQFPESSKNISVKDKTTTWSIQYGEEEDEHGNLIPKMFSALPILRELAEFYAPMVYVLEKMREESPADWKQYLTTILPVVNPLATVTNMGGRDANFGWQGFPTAGGIAPIQHVWDIFRNHDSFRNQEIVSADLRKLPNAQQYNEYTSDLAKRVGRYTNVSPMLIDQFWNVGFFREFITAGDQILRHFEDPTYDPELDGIAAEIEGYLNLMWEGGESKKRRNAVIDGYLYGSTENFSSDEIRQIKVYINKNLDDKEGKDVFAATSMENRLHRKGGRQKQTYGVLQANRAFKVDSQETALMEDQIKILRNTMRDAQIKSDEDLWMNHDVARTDGTTMSGREWIAARQTAGDGYRVSLGAFASMFPNAAQVNWLTSTGGSVADFKKFKDLIFTGAGKWEDTRLKSQIYAAGYRGIAMTYIGGPNTGSDDPDYARYFREREEFRADMIKKEGAGSDTLREFDDELIRYDSDMERRFQEDMTVLRPYWEMPHQLLLDDPRAANPNLPPEFEGLPRGELRDTWAEYLASNNDQRAVMDAEGSPVEQRLINIRKKLTGYRETFREANPEMDLRYIRWGYAVAHQTDAGFLELQRLQSLAGKPVIAEYEGQTPTQESSPVSSPTGVPTAEPESPRFSRSFGTDEFRRGY